MSSVGDDVMTPVSFKSNGQAFRHSATGVFIYRIRTWPLESPLPALHFGDDPTSHVPLVCPSTTGPQA